MRPSQPLAVTARLSFLLFLLLGYALAASAADDFEAGVRAFRAGDTANALSIWKRLAESGNSTAQYNLGVVYEQGKGVTVNIPQAMIWYRKAAEKGRPDAQNNLGVLYAEGRGVQRDLEKAYIWLTLAMSQGYQPAIANRKLIEGQLQDVHREAIKKRLWTYYTNYVEPFQGANTASVSLPASP